MFSRYEDIRRPSRRTVLRAGGAGVVAGVAGATFGETLSAQADALTEAIPQVDRLAVRIVIDTNVRQFVPPQKLDDMTVERMGGNQRPDAPPRTALGGQWGLSMFAESRRGSETRQVLMDFGYTPEVLLNNLDILKIDPAKFDAFVLSHGHYDHFGGMAGLLAATKGRLKANLPFVVGGEECFCTRLNLLNKGQFGTLSRKAIQDANLSLVVSGAPRLVADHAFTTGTVPMTSFESLTGSTAEKVGAVDGLGCRAEDVAAAKNTGDYVNDDFAHEIATGYVVKGKGLVLLTSCSHRGIINTIRRAQAVSGVQKVHAVIGGFHLTPPLTESYYTQVIATLKEMDPDYLMPGHCTGEVFCDMVRQAMPKKVIFPYVGTQFTFGA